MFDGATFARMSIARAFRSMNVVTLVAIVALFIFFSEAHWRSNATIRGDAQGYCSYLASWVVYGDFNFDFYENLDPENQSRYWLNHYEGAKPFPKLTMGVALLQLPAFYSAHILAPFFEFEQDGWSIPYHLAIGLNGLFVFLFGLWMLLKWLKRRFSPFISSLTVLLIAFATNAFFYGTLDSAQSHIYSFTLFATALYCFDLWLEQNRRITLVISALLFGFICLIRPTNGIFMLLPLVYLLMDEKHRNSFLKPSTWLAVLAFCLPIIPQLMLWKMNTGHWIFYSYGEEKILWSHPSMLQGLFSYRNGWLLYTPIMVLALIGPLFSASIDKKLTLALSILIPLHIYVVFSWWCWYYGSSLSIRPMIDFYPLLAFGLAATLRWLATKNSLVWLGTGALLVFLICNQSIQTLQYHTGQLSGSDMTKRAFNRLFMNLDAPSDMALTGAFDAPDIEMLLLGKPERLLRDTIVEKEWKLEGIETGLELSTSKDFSSPLQVGAAEFQTDFDRTMCVTCEVESHLTEKSEAFLVISFLDSNLTYGYHTLELHKMAKHDGQARQLSAYLRKPAELPPSGYMEAYLWYKKGKGSLKVNGLAIEQLDCPRVATDYLTH